jgi:signal transduction histidine kinase
MINKPKSLLQYIGFLCIGIFFGIALTCGQGIEKINSLYTVAVGAGMGSTIILIGILIYVFQDSIRIKTTRWAPKIEGMPSGTLFALKWGISIGLIYSIVGYLYPTLVEYAGENPWSRSFLGSAWVMLNCILIGGGFYVLAIKIMKWTLRHSRQHYLDAQSAQKKAKQHALLTASMAHDAMNVLTSLRFCTELLERNVKPSSVTEDLFKTIKKAGIELAGFNRRFISIGEPDSIENNFEARDLVQETKNILALAQMNERVETCQISLYGDDHLDCLVAPSLFGDMMLNLIINAADATKNKGTIIIHIRRVDNCALVEIHDNGPGILDTDQEKIFEPFYTTKKVGSGLGLLNVRNCIEIHNGRLHIGTSPLGGAVFSMWIPLSKEVTHLPDDSPAIYWTDPSKVNQILF